MNIEFEYRYRDLGNFKKYGAVVFGNRDCLTIDEICNRVSSSLADERSFNASRCGIPNLFFSNFPFDPDLDHDSHEFFGASESDLPVNDAAKRDILDLLEEMQESVAARK
jgi:hypothetical protein